MEEGAADPYSFRLEVDFIKAFPVSTPPMAHPGYTLGNLWYTLGTPWALPGTPVATSWAFPGIDYPA